MYLIKLVVQQDTITKQASDCMPCTEIKYTLHENICVSVVL